MGLPKYSIENNLSNNVEFCLKIFGPGWPVITELYWQDKKCSKLFHFVQIDSTVTQFIPAQLLTPIEQMYILIKKKYKKYINLLTGVMYRESKNSIIFILIKYANCTLEYINNGHALTIVTLGFQ